MSQFQVHFFKGGEKNFMISGAQFLEHQLSVKVFDQKWTLPSMQAFQENMNCMLSWPYYLKQPWTCMRAGSNFRCDMNRREVHCFLRCNSSLSNRSPVPSLVHKIATQNIEDLKQLIQQNLDLTNLYLMNRSPRYNERYSSARPKLQFNVRERTSI